MVLESVNNISEIRGSEMMSELYLFWLLWFWSGLIGFLLLCLLTKPKQILFIDLFLIITGFFVVIMVLVNVSRKLIERGEKWIVYQRKKMK